jgi:polysaccharide transporter, PST family
MLLGTWLTPQHAAFFFAAEKLCYPLAWLLGPINTAMMPRLTRLIDSSPERARRMAGLALLLMLATGTVLALGVALASPWLVPLVFGPGYEPARPVIQVLALIIPLVVANSALGGQWLIPHGIDRFLTLSVLAGAVVHVGLALALLPGFGAIGIAWAAVSGQATVLAGLILALHRHGLITGAWLGRR